MEFFRRASNPWGQEVLLGIAWNLIWAAVIVGLVFVIGHALYVKLIAQPQVGDATQSGNGAAAGIPAKILRHTKSSRAFHWLMSIAMFVLLITAFFPVIGIRFPWVTIHWIAGIGLLATIVYHIVHATIWQDFWAMWIDKGDIEAGSIGVKRFFKKTNAATPKAGKYPVDHKLYHNTISVVSIAAIATGLLMMVRIDTPFWARNPYILSDSMWGFVYVVHGLSGVALITMVIAHIYFAIRPEKWWITMSMINGWVGRDDYLEHFDPKRWVVSGESDAEDAAALAERGKQPVA